MAKIVGDELIEVLIEDLLDGIYVVPKGIRIIGERAFFGIGLKGVVIPGDVIEIGDFAFAHNQLTSIEIPLSVKKINESVFSANKLTSITIPKGVVEIGKNAFAHNNLTSIIIPANVKVIQALAFTDNYISEYTVLGDKTIIDKTAFDSNYSVPKKYENLVEGISNYIVSTGKLAEKTGTSNTIQVKSNQDSGKIMGFSFLIRSIENLEKEKDIKIGFDYPTLLSLVDYIIDITDKQFRINQNFENYYDAGLAIINYAFNNAISNGRDSVIMDDFVSAISCSKYLLSSKRNEAATHLYEDFHSQQK